MVVADFGLAQLPSSGLLLCSALFSSASSSSQPSTSTFQPPTSNQHANTPDPNQPTPDLPALAGLRVVNNPLALLAPTSHRSREASNHEMKGRPIDQLVYERMFPSPKPTDPRNFQELLQCQIVPEVRHETQAFYGSLCSQEAKYPGLDYAYRPHRNRLARYTWHRRLFRAFDDLRLTPNEIATLTKWEGTRSAKERFEKEQGVIIRDTTADEIEDWVEPELRVASSTHAQRVDAEEMEDILEGNERENEADADMDDDSDAEIHSVGDALNARLREAVAQREAGNTSTIMDEEWEQWLKDVVEAGSLPFFAPNLSPNANIPGTRPASNRPTPHPRPLHSTASSEPWQGPPDFLQFMMRRHTDTNGRRAEDAQPSAAPTISVSTPTSRFPPRPIRPESLGRSTLRSGTSTGSSTFQRLVNRLDVHFADHQSSRRPVPPLPSSAAPATRPAASSSRHRLARSHPGGS